MGITGIMKIITCQHVKLYNFQWLCIEEGKAPSFTYNGLPSSGTITLSKHTIEVCCARCHMVPDDKILSN